MEVGSLNRRFGWWLLGIGMLYGVTLKMLWKFGYWPMPDTLTNPGRAEFWKHTLLATGHAHGNLFAIINILYGLYIEEANLTDNLKKIGSILAVVGAILFPLGLILSGGISQIFDPLSAIGGLCMIAAVFILAKGQLKS